MQYLLYYLILINALIMLFMLWDKQKARRHRWRIPEATLMTMAFLGGSVGGIVGMYLFHHKTKKPLFYIGFPAAFLLHLGIFLWIIL